jgi:hypothetical protein
MKSQKLHMQINSFQHINSDETLHKNSSFILFCVQLLNFHQPRALRGTISSFRLKSLSAADDNCNYFRSRLFPQRCESDAAPFVWMELSLRRWQFDGKIDAGRETRRDIDFHFIIHGRRKKGTPTFL